MPISRYSRALRRWCLPLLIPALLLPLAASEGMDVFGSRQEPSPPAAPAPAPAPDVAALPKPVPPVVTPPAGTAVPGALPTVPLTPGPEAVAVTKVAILLPLSGPHAGLGHALLNAAQIALFSLAGESFALLPVDTRGTPDGAVAAVRTALDDGASLILGPVFSAAVAAATPLARDAGVQMVSFSNDRSVAGNGVYVMGFTPETQIGRIMSFAASRGIRRIAAILPLGAYGDRVNETLRAIAPTTGIDFAYVARYSTADTQTLTPIVRRLANYDARHKALLEERQKYEGKTAPESVQALKRLEHLDTLGDVDFDAVLIPEGGAALHAIAPLLAFFDIDPRKVRMLGTTQWDDPAVATEPSLFGAWFPAAPPAARRAFEDVYRKTYGEAPSRITALAYDATALAAVIERRQRAAPRMAAGGPTPPAPPPVFSVETLTVPSGFSGVDGIFRPLPSGLVERGLAVMQVENRRVRVVSPAPARFVGPSGN
ncbi:MAG: penicillin-binding protein activator [Alphaproteobacteria bacterium]